MIEVQHLLQVLNSNYSLYFDKIKFYRKGGCVSYIASSGNKKYLLKVISTAFQDTVIQSLEIITYLVNNDFPTPRIIMTTEGLPYLSIGNVEENYLCVLYRFIEGSEPDLGEDVEVIGELVGRLHNIMQRYDGKLTIHNKQFFIDRYIDILIRKGYSDQKIDIFKEYGDALWKRIEYLPQGYCHGDLHRGNLLRKSVGHYYLLDFDTSCYSFPMYDIMVMCDSTNYFIYEADGYLRSKSIYESFLNGYLKYRTLTNLEIMSFYDLIAVRHYQLQATIIEINGLDCINYKFLDKQLDWLMRWRNQCEMAHK